MHLYYLVGFQNRLLVVTRWTFRFITCSRGARVISEDSRARADSDVSG